MLGFISERTLRNKMPIKRPRRKKTQATRLGKANGNSLKKLLLPKISGYLSAGFASAPPRIGPSILPTVQTSGIMLKALGWRIFWGTSSATVVRMVPTLPLLAPASALAASAKGREREKPKIIQEVIVQQSANKIIGLRPNRSDALPTAIPVQA